MDKVLYLLSQNQDNNYKEFASKLAPTVDKSAFYGVRVPVLRKLLKEITPFEKELFMKELPHKYYEENLLHGFMIQEMKDYDKCIIELNKFLPYVDNWAVSDTMCPKIFKKHKEDVLKHINKWIKSDHTYTIRFGVDVLMTYYLDEDFKEEYLYLVKDIKSDEYYVNMMISWFYATALAKQYDKTIKLLENNELDKWVHNKTIRKAIESFRISSEQKDYLKSLTK